MAPNQNDRGAKTVIVNENEIRITHELAEGLPNLRAITSQNFGLDPERLIRGLSLAIELMRDYTDLRKDSISRIEHCDEQMMANELDILRQHLGK